MRTDPDADLIAALRKALDSNDLALDLVDELLTCARAGRMPASGDIARAQARSDADRKVISDVRRSLLMLGGDDSVRH